MKGLRTDFKTDPGSPPGTAADFFLSQENLFIVTEGVGDDHLAERAGERACRRIAESFFRHLSRVPSPGEALVSALRETNDDILRERMRVGDKMAASVSVVYVRGDVMYFSHLGDTRIYCLHKGEIVQLTRDHTLREEEPYLDAKTEDPRLMRALTDALGIHPEPDIRVKTFALREKDIILMTTEGLTRYLSNKQILNLASKTHHLNRLSDLLLNEARRRGGENGMTVGLIRFEGTIARWPKRVFLFSLLLLVLLVAAAVGLYMREPGERKAPVPERRPERSAGGVAPERPAPAGKPPITPAKAPEVSGVEKVPVLEEEIAAFLSRWERAWEESAGPQGDMKAYMAFYGPTFRSRGMDRDAWERDKAEKNRKKSYIRVDLDDIKIGGQEPDGRLEVRFDQRYRSSNYSGTSRKMLLLKKEEKGWKILAEESL
ncbi:MAG: protein phosphatase 2C domain-containing protein [Deltaproteobacteria bacterium]|nr:protein phosphatase 2C domain-containing protein [Deltaproteobacteria bacterium]